MHNKRRAGDRWQVARLSSDLQNACPDGRQHEHQQKGDGAVVYSRGLFLYNLSSTRGCMIVVMIVVMVVVMGVSFALPWLHCLELSINNSISEYLVLYTVHFFRSDHNFH